MNSDFLADVLVAPWSALPPLDRVTPQVFAVAHARALAATRRAWLAVADEPGPPTFDNTIAALEAAAAPLARVEAVRQLFASTRATPAMVDENAQLAPVSGALEDELAAHPKFFARIGAVADMATDPAEQRLARAWQWRLRRRGAGLVEAERARLAAVNARLAELQARFAANLTREEGEQVLRVADAGRMDGLPASVIDRAAEPDGTGWALAVSRPMMTTVLGHARDRALRREFHALWISRGANDGANDNRRLIAEILVRRGEKARLLGYPHYAALAFEDRMAADPATARAQLERVWAGVRARAMAQLDGMAELARANGVDRIEPWDRLYYAERLKAGRFGYDAEAVRAHLPLDRVVRAAIECAERLHGLRFTELSDAPVHHPDARAYAVKRDNHDIGTLVLDLLGRPDKQPGSWQQELRPACAEGGAIAVVCSGNPRSPPGAPQLMGWAHANVLFHEFGHALHMLLGRAPYPGSGSMGVAWDFIETPALLNERWLDRATLARHARHHATGAPMSDTLIDGLLAANTAEGNFTVTLDYLAVALVDLALHEAADGGAVDWEAVAAAEHARLELPLAIDPMMQPPNAYHLFAGEHYPAGLYSYLWSDVLAADIAEAFADAPGGLLDRQVSARWRGTLLAVGATIDPAEGFRAFRGRDPDEGALLRRYSLA